MIQLASDIKTNKTQHLSKPFLIRHSMTMWPVYYEAVDVNKLKAGLKSEIYHVSGLLDTKYIKGR